MEMIRMALRKKRGKDNKITEERE